MMLRLKGDPVFLGRAMRPMRMWIGVLAVLAAVTAAAQEPRSYRAGVDRFVSDMVRKHGFAEGEVAALMAQASYSQAVIDAIRRPYEAKPWYRYRQIFVTEKRVQGGVSFWREHSDVLERARVVYGVPPQIVTAIIGVETNYGSNPGKHRVIDALSTLGFSYPKRADFFRRELEQLLLLSREELIDASSAKGSYAGAVGLPQFIPSSYRAYAIDFDSDGRRDLWESTADAIGSVGNYLARHGWQAEAPVALEARVPGAVPKGIAVAEKKPRKPGTPLGRLQAAGIGIGASLPETTRATLIRLEAPDPEHWLGLANFYAITRYNHSNLYAMAVYQLGNEIRAAYERGGAEKNLFGRSGGFGE